MEGGHVHQFIEVINVLHVNLEYIVVVSVV